MDDPYTLQQLISKPSCAQSLERSIELLYEDVRLLYWSTRSLTAGHLYQLTPHHASQGRYQLRGEYAAFHAMHLR
jgi:hypothetical protein